MIRVGIITFHRAVNYGAVLQTVGLFKAITKIRRDCKVEIIDYRNDHIEKMYSPFYSQEKNPIKRIIKMLLYANGRIQKKRQFESFIHDNTELSKKYDKNTIKEANDDYDIFITGSDQVWHNGCAAFDGAYFLTEVSDEEKINSYAASFGKERIPEDLVDEYRRRLVRFKNISVREKSAKTITNELLNRSDIEVVLDPTLLWDKKFWEQYSDDDNKKEKYILLYTVNTPIKLIEYAKKLSSITGYPIYYINDAIFKKDKDLNYVSNVSPQKFLGLIKNAQYIVTNSFHGTVFSIIFERNFYVELETDGGVNNRVRELLEMLGLVTRKINIEKPNIDYVIDWKDVNDRLSEYRNNSIKYLSKVLEE